MGWGLTPDTTELNYSSPVGVSAAPATGLQLYLAASVAYEAQTSDVFIAGYYGQAVYEFNTATGNASTVAGNGIPGLAGDGAAADGAESGLRPMTSTNKILGLHRKQFWAVAAIRSQ